LSRRERRAVFVEECRFLLIPVLPLAILVVLAIAGVSYTRIIQVIVLTGVLSLGFWGGVAGQRAGLTGWVLVLSIAYGLLLGGIILVLQAMLQPGNDPFRP
jgi:Na+/H+ antiporter NhaC